MTRIFQLFLVAALLSACSQHGEAVAPTANAPSSKPQVWEQGPLPQKWQFFPNVQNGGVNNAAQPVTLSSIVTDGDYHVWAAYWFDDFNSPCGGPGVVEYNFSGTLLSSPEFGCPEIDGLVAGGDGNVYVIDGRYIIGITPSGQQTQNVDAAFPVKHLAEEPNVGLYYTIYDRAWMVRVLNGVKLNYHFPNLNERADLIAIDHANRIWVSTTAGLAQFNPSTAHFTFSDIADIVAKQLVVGPDNNLWFVSGSTLSRVTTNTSKPTLTRFTMPVSTLTGYLTSGPDGNLWMTYGHAGLLSVNTSGRVVSNLTCPTNVCNPNYGGAVRGITAGADENIWFVYEANGGGDEQFDPYTGIVSYIRLSINVTPSAVTLSPGKTQTLTIAETNYSGAWTASSTQPGVVKVLSVYGNAVHIQATAAGKGRIIIKDSKTNYVSIPVTVQ